MKQSIFKEKYSVFTLELNKDEINEKSCQEIIATLKEKIDAHPVATFIATFDHYGHTSKLEDAQINPEIKDVQNIIFCFGKEIPTTKVAAVRPRSIGVCETEDKFIIEFMEAPNEAGQKTMEDWAKSLKK
jgi:hypothetical protein